jgi:transposase
MLAAAMRVFVAGATGALGAPLVRTLVAARHEVVGLTRSAARTEFLRALGARAAVADALDAAALRAAVVESKPHAVVQCTVPGVGPVTAAAVVATLDDVGRFASAGQVAAYVGLVPRERSSGEQQRRGPLTKAGNSRVRWLLV